MKHTISLFALALAFAACSDQNKQVQQAAPVAETAPQVVAPVAANPLDASWSLDSTVDKMTNIPRNKLIKEARTDRHIYKFIFNCDSDGLAVKAEAYLPTNEGAKITWDADTTAKGSRNIRLRAGEKMARITLNRSDFSNTGILELNSEAELLAFAAALQGDKTAQIKNVRNIFRDMKFILSQDILNIADIFPDEVIELNTTSGKPFISEFLLKCDRFLPSLPQEPQEKKVIPVVKSPEGEGVESVSSNSQTPPLKSESTEPESKR